MALGVVGSRGYSYPKDRTSVLSPAAHLHAPGEILHERQYDEELASATLTLDADDSGKTFGVTVTSVITLPAVDIGLRFKFVNCGSKDGEVQMSLSPPAFAEVVGCDLASAHSKDIINTLLTAKVGDYVIVTGAGNVAGRDTWYVQGMRGTWAVES